MPQVRLKISVLVCAIQPFVVGTPMTEAEPGHSVPDPIPSVQAYGPEFWFDVEIWNQYTFAFWIGFHTMRTALSVRPLTVENVGAARLIPAGRGVGEGPGVLDGILVGVLVGGGVEDGVLVCVIVGVRVGVWVGVRVGVGVLVGVGVGVFVGGSGGRGVDVLVGIGTGVFVGVLLGIGVFGLGVAVGGYVCARLRAV